MLLGFISLLITAGTNPISKICIPLKFGDIMLPCKHESKKLLYNKDGFSRRKLLWYAGNSAPAGGEGYCSKYGKIQLISQSGVHQLHIFIFLLGVFHILYSVIGMALAQAKMKKWKAWEIETTSLEYEFTNDPSRFRITHETSFVRRHTSFSKLPGLRWIVAFFRQFFASVTNVDYLTMRHGFINAHFAPNSQFNFHKYIKRSMEDDFKLVVGISVPLWIFAILFQLLNVYRWYTLFVISFLPPIMILIIGAKLQLIIMEMAQQIQDRATIVKGIPVVEPRNDYFWLNQPDLILFLMHFTLFQNAFQMAYFLWTWYEFGLTSCFHENLPLILTKVFLGVAFQVLCGYITFPVYALVTQMGSHMKRSIFEDQIANALKRWQKKAKERKKLRQITGAEVSNFRFISGKPTPSHDSPPIHLLHIYTHKSIGIENNFYSPNAHCSETEASRVEGPSMVSCGDHQTRPENSAKEDDDDLHYDVDFSLNLA
ncbi:MLO protein homolog 1-like isoform X2 [Rhododendron vialii]|nr:MLO protein homolog 1-like isoform X2 [Rhododendron vialii]